MSQYNFLNRNDDFLTYHCDSKYFCKIYNLMSNTVVSFKNIMMLMICLSFYATDSQLGCLTWFLKLLDLQEHLCSSQFPDRGSLSPSELRNFLFMSKNSISQQKSYNPIPNLGLRTINTTKIFYFISN